MLYLLVGLVCLQILLMIILLLRRTKSGATAEELRQELLSRERAQLDAAERLRGGLDEAIQRSGKLHSDAQREMATQVQKAIADGFIAAQQHIAGTLADARKAQDERLDRVD